VPSIVPAKPPPAAHAIADPERPRAGEHAAGDDVAERLLGLETHHDGGHRATDGQRARVEAGDPQRGDDHDRHRRQTDEEADGAGVLQEAGRDLRGAAAGDELAQSNGPLIPPTAVPTA
jgi:hypothetical protein